ncbi:MAG TPA: hypothetical protein DCP32_11275 [Anaerolineaceae bacterium]|nr:MAG: hypothetical protein A2X24_13040 [Chloroflexi bacterium GWB2_54_36]HAL17294.1 hypothetical protein [Anaerolineaceae bacterium]HBA92621.1 hypothetical protein [Anaerolineaceae bacterium]
MPRLSVWFIRASLIYLLAGFMLGALLLANNGIEFMPSAWELLPAHVEFLLAGWVVQLALGTAYWILPRHTRGLARGSTELGWLSFSLFNLGVLLTASSGLLPGAFQFAGRVLEVLAAGLFLVLIWPRIKAYGA